MKKIIISLLVINSFLFISCGGNSSASKKNVLVSGSSSVTPLMFKLAEKFEEANTNYSVTVETSDSTIGVQDTISGKNDIGMASRDLKDSEKASGLSSKVIALDGIAVIVNNENTLDNITSEQVMKIYTGEITSWVDIVK